MRRGPHLVLLLALLASAATAGCFGEKRSPVDVYPYLATHAAEPGRAVVVPLFLNSTYTFKDDYAVTSGDLPEGWKYLVPEQKVTLPGYKGRFVVVEVTPAPDAPPGEQDVNFFVGDTRVAVRVNVTALGPTPAPGSTVNLTWVHFDRNGTLLGWQEPLLHREGLKVHPNATEAPGPTLARLGGEGDPTPGVLRLTPALEARLLQAKVGEAVLVDSADVPAPLTTAEGGSDGARLLVRLVGVQEAGAA